MPAKPRFSENDRHNLQAAFGLDPENPQHQYGASDERSFGDILMDWMIALGCHLDASGDFLSRVGLAHALTPEQWQGLVQGRVAPGKELAGLLYVLMEDSTRAAHADMSMPTFEVHMYRAESARNFHMSQQREENVITVSREAHHALRRPLLKKMHDAIFPRIAREWEAKISTGGDPDTLPGPLQHPIIAGASKRVGCTPEEALQALGNAYRLLPEGLLQSLQEDHPDMQEADIKRWLEQTLSAAPQEPVHFGQIVRMLRQSQGDFINAYDDDIRFPISNHGRTNGRWERGEAATDPDYLPALKQCFHLDDDDYRLVLEARLPHFNHEWLDTQPPAERNKLYKTLTRVGMPEQLKEMQRLKSESLRTPIRQLFSDPGAYFAEHKIEPRMQQAVMLSLCISASEMTNTNIVNHIRCGEATIFNMKSGRQPISSRYVIPMADYFERCDPEHSWFDRAKFLAIYEASKNAARAESLYTNEISLTDIERGRSL